MPQTMLPRLFVPSVIRWVVAPGYPGVYILGNDLDGFIPGYVGRSDSCLQKRLLTHNYGGEFEYFVFRYARSVKEAYHLECQFWHVYSLKQVDLLNFRHPAAPPQSQLVCPYCHFAQHVTKLLAC